jgi:ribosomal protein S12 methylthiotransferase
MRRPASSEKVLERIARWREICPDITIRSTFIVGFPGETEQDFEFLLNWLEEAKLDRVGCFRYENVADADSNDITGHVPQDVIEDRWNRFMAVQQKISAERLKRHVGKVLPILIDEVTEDGIIGRSYADAPEIDGVVHVKSKGRVLAGTMVNVKIEDSDEYDLFGTVINK